MSASGRRAVRLLLAAPGLRRLPRADGQRGQVLVVFALGIVAMLGAVGVGIDSSRMFQHRRSAQAAADHGALTGARLMCSDATTSTTALEAQVRSIVAENGFPHNPPVTEVTVTKLAASATTVQVTVTTGMSATFSRVLGFSNFDVTTTGVAGGDGCDVVASGGEFGAIYAGGNTCTTGGSAGIDVSGSSQNILGGIHTNADIKITGGNNSFHELTSPDLDDPVTYKGNILVSGAGSTFQPGYPLDLYASSTVPAPVWPDGWAPSFVTGGLGAPPTAGSMLRRYYDIADANGTNAADDTLFTDKVTSLTKDGVYFTSSPLGMDITHVSGPRNVVLVAPNGPIKVSSSSTVLTALTEAQLDLLPNVPTALNLPRSSILMLSTMPKVGTSRCSEYTIAMAGSGHVWSGILWAPTGVIEISGSDNAGVDGAAIGWAVRMNGTVLTIRAMVPTAFTPLDPSIVMIQ